MAIDLQPANAAEAGQELSGAPLADLITQLAEAIAAGQARLDLSSAQVVEQLANAKVMHIPEVRQIIEEDGSVRFEHAEPIELSLLDLGITPSFFAFSEASVEVAMDLKVEESNAGSGNSQSIRLVAATRSIRSERRLNRNVEVHTKVKATIVTVPAPELLSTNHVIEDRREEGGV